MNAKAVLFDELGGPEVLRFADVEINEPGPGEALVRIEAIGLNRSEVLFRTGAYYYEASLPGSRLGNEAAGVIETVGPETGGFAPGDLVTILPRPNDLGMSEHGVYADRVVVPASRLTRLPDSVDAITGAAAGMSLFTAYGGLFDAGGLRPGHTVLITAASSSVGLAAIQIARHVGAVPIAVTRSAAKASRLLEAGAAHVIATDDENVLERTQELTGGRGVDIVFDCIAGDGLQELALTIAPDGTLVVYGTLAGFPPLPLNWPLRIHGYAIFHLFADAERTRQAEAFIAEGLRTGSLSPIVDRVFDFGEIADAHRHMESNDQVGKIVVTIAH
jgi:NADPH:quinone reductase-like Zn-dependent oxidoreductase